MSDLATQNQKNQNHASSFESTCLITVQDYLYTRNLSLDQVFVVFKQKMKDFFLTIQEFEEDFLDCPFTSSYRSFTFLLSTCFTLRSPDLLEFEVKIEETQGVTRLLKRNEKWDKDESIEEVQERLEEKMRNLMKRKTITKLIEENKENEEDKKRRRLNEIEY